MSFPTILNQTPFLRSAITNKDGYIYFGVTAIYGASLLTGNKKLQKASILTLKAVIESYVVSHLILKSIFSTYRPRRPLGEVGGSDRESHFPIVNSHLDFFNWHLNTLGSKAYRTGFPSYHATMYFPVASVTSRVFDNYWIPHAAMIPLLCHSTEGHNHWVSEVAAGAVIGEFIGKVVYENYHERRNTSYSLKKRRKYRTHMGIDQNFGVVGPSIAINW